MSDVSTFNIILETKVKIERNKVQFPDNIIKLKNSFLNATGMGEKEWSILYNSPPIKDQQDFNNLLESLY
ncbi:hypothetical protein NE686_18270 [Tissierella carlieri]|uniref:Uncharacterized protein n=1 Tax=Tissierella carlieri TaxID=689904 RepID=A0ABT1SEX7_9FIRM|nr:hypothetical protein [Tissierella carlieri]MCQ4925053.1 hypothetical protein [Tissierella carlieri]